MKAQRGFTLIELILVVSLISILLGFITINLFRSQQNASSYALEGTLVADLRQQQLKSMIGDTEGRASADQYGIYFDTNQYIFFHGTYPPGDSSNFVINLDENFQFESPGTHVTFQKITGEVLAGSVSSVTLRNITNGDAKTIRINKYGVVTEVN
jgi:prepilin-type N-terminal cleavage/methylation domain-containing protein